MGGKGPKNCSEEADGTNPKLTAPRRHCTGTNKKSTQYSKPASDVFYS